MPETNPPLSAKRKKHDTMQINRKIILLGAGMALTLGGTVSAGAQSLVSPSADSTRVLTLQEAVELSYRQNPAMEAQRIAREAAVDRRKSAWGLRMPQLGVTAAYTYMSEDI